MKKVLMVIGGILVSIIILVIVLWTISSFTSNKLVCESSKGNITILYNDKTIKGYKAVGGLTYEMDKAKETVEDIGIDSYIELFKQWFATNMSGTCEVKLK